MFPFAAFVLCGTVAGSALGRVDYAKRKRRSISRGLGLLAGGFLLALALSGRVDFWGPSPAYALLRLGGLLLLLRLVESGTSRELPGTRALALLGHETLLVYVLHLVLLFGGILGPGPLLSYAGRLGFGGSGLVLLLMLPLLSRCLGVAPGENPLAPQATLALVFWVVFVLEFLTRPGDTSNSHGEAERPQTTRATAASYWSGVRVYAGDAAEDLTVTSSGLKPCGLRPGRAGCARHQRPKVSAVKLSAARDVDGLRLLGFWVHHRIAAGLRRLARRCPGRSPTKRADSKPGREADALHEQDHRTPAAKMGNHRNSFAGSRPDLGRQGLQQIWAPW